MTRVYSFWTGPLLIVGLLLIQFSPSAYAGVQAFSPEQTYCNPLNLDYGTWKEKDVNTRHAADPVIVLFKDKYYLFDTLDRRGYRVSDDLLHWKTILFDPETLLYATAEMKGLVAPAVYTDGQSLYFNNFGSKHLLKTNDPSNGHWDQLSLETPVGDPDFFLDDDGKLYMIGGLSEITIWQVNPSDFSTVPGSRIEAIPNFHGQGSFEAANSPYGLYYGHRVYNRLDWNKPEALDTSSLDLSAANSGPPTLEGNWMTKYHGRYYLQDSNPDTACPWYSDSVWEADNIKGPYKLADYSPASMKVGGFINSTGHSCVFQDRYGNWWRVTTMWIGTRAGFERRLGLFRVGFDDKGRMFTQTALGDYPMVMPTGPVDPNTHSPLAGWFVLSTHKACTASSSLPKHDPELASDENVRTWWSAQTGNPDEWFQIDLGNTCTVNAVQVNFAEEGCQTIDPSEDYHAYKILVSTDGTNWTTAIDKAANKTCIPHDYVAFDQPLKVRYLKVVNVHAARLGKFALRDLRVFGNAGGAPPAQVTGLTITRHSDARHVTFSWNPVAGADGYVIHYGVAPDALHLNIQYQGQAHSQLTVSCLNRDVKYFYRIDAYNGSGITTGRITQTAE